MSKGMEVIAELVDKLSVDTLRIGGVNTDTPLKIQINAEVRFIRLSLQMHSVLHLDQVEAIDAQGNNVALGARVVASSYYDDQPKYAGDGLVDGHKTGGVGFHSKHESNPWCVIDLGATQRVKIINVYNRDDQWAFRTNSLKAAVSKDLSDWHLLYDGLKSIRHIETIVEDSIQAGLEELLLLPSLAAAYACIVDGVKLTKLLDKATTIGCGEKVLASANKKLEPLQMQLTSHGIGRVFTFYGEDKKQALARQIKKLSELLKNEIGVDSFICAGTLLGAVRNDTFIGHDDDIDMTYVSKYSNSKDIIKERKHINQMLLQHGYRVTKAMGQGCHFHIYGKNGFMADLFTSWVEGEEYFLYPLKKGGLKKHHILPVKQRELHNHKINVPLIPEHILNHNYGPSWQEPDPLWRFDWSHVKEDFGFLTVH